MTTNSPNPVDGDVQALIERCQEFIKQCEYARHAEAMTEADEMDFLITQMALTALTTKPVAYWHHSGQVITRDECHDDRVFEICCKVERPLYTTPPAQILRPVELPKSQRLDGNGYGYYFDMDDVFRALEKSGVPFKSQG